MDIHQLEAKVSEYVATVMVPKAHSWQAKFALGAGARAMAGRLEPFVRAAGVVNGDDVDVGALREIVLAGFRSAGHVDVFGGLLGFDPQDAEELFDHVGT